MAKHKAPRPDIGRRLNALMKSSTDCRTQTALAKRSGVPQSTIGRISRGEVNPGIDNLEKLAAALGTSVDQLTRGKGGGRHGTFDNLNPSDESSRNDHVGSDRPVRLTGSIVATALAAIEWRLKLVGMTYDLRQSPEIMAQALNWATHESAENLAALEAALVAHVRTGEAHARTTEDRPPALEPADSGARATGRARSRR